MRHEGQKRHEVHEKHKRHERHMRPESHEENDDFITDFHKVLLTD